MNNLLVNEQTLLCFEAKRFCPGLPLKERFCLRGHFKAFTFGPGQHPALLFVLIRLTFYLQLEDCAALDLSCAGKYNYKSNRPKFDALFRVYNWLTTCDLSRAIVFKGVTCIPGLCPASAEEMPALIFSLTVVKWGIRAEGWRELNSGKVLP